MIPHSTLHSKHKIALVFLFDLSLYNFVIIRGLLSAYVLENKKRKVQVNKLILEAQKGNDGVMGNLWECNLYHLGFT